MKKGRSDLNQLPQEVQARIISKYGSLNDYYFEIWYNRHQHYGAHNSGNTERSSELDEEFDGFEDELQEFGLIDGGGTVHSISNDHGDMIAKKYVTEKLGETGMDKESIKEFIKKYLDQ